MYLRILSLSLSPFSSGSGPLCFFILEAICQVLRIVSPTRPIPCESEPWIEMAPMQ